MVLPDGKISMTLEMSMNTLTRGEKLLDLGRSYSSVPNAGAYVPGSEQLIDWGDYELHMPTIRPFALRPSRMPWSACLMDMFPRLSLQVLH